MLNQTINLAGRREVSILQLARKCLRLVDRNTDDLEFVADRKRQVMKEKIDIFKAEKLLDWEPKVNINLGLKKSLEWIHSILTRKQK